MNNPNASPPYLVLSPHPDDAAINLGGLLSALSERSAPIHILTVFTKSGYAPGREDIENNVPAVTKCRLYEEHRFAETISAQLTYLDLNDSSVEGMDGVQERKADPVTDTRAGAVKAALKDLRPRLVFAPAGIGGHVDHLIVSRCAVECFKDVAPIFFYEDLPYASYFSPIELESELNLRLNSDRVEMRVPFARQEEKKRALLHCYPSQILPEREDLILRYARQFGGEHPVERLWYISEGGDVTSYLTLLAPP